MLPRGGTQRVSECGRHPSRRERPDAAAASAGAARNLADRTGDAPAPRGSADGSSLRARPGSTGRGAAWSGRRVQRAKVVKSASKVREGQHDSCAHMVLQTGAVRHAHVRTRRAASGPLRRPVRPARGARERNSEPTANGIGSRTGNSRFATTLAFRCGEKKTARRGPNSKFGIRNPPRAPTPDAPRPRAPVRSDDQVNL